jgi:hypothetical protein
MRPPVPSLGIMSCAMRAAYSPLGVFSTSALSNFSRSDNAETSIGYIIIVATKAAAIKEPNKILLLPAIGFCISIQQLYF